MWTLPCAQLVIRKRWLIWVPGGVVLMAPQVFTACFCLPDSLTGFRGCDPSKSPSWDSLSNFENLRTPSASASSCMACTPGSTPQEETTPRFMCSSNVSWVSLRTLCLAWQLHERVTYMPHSPQGWQVYIDSFLYNQIHLAEEDPDQGGASTVLC